MDRGAQKCSEHAIVLSDDRCLWLVRGKAVLAAISRRVRPVCAGVDGEADGDHAALRFVAAGLLAARQACG